jgi:hypothetical protein
MTRRDADAAVPRPPIGSGSAGCAPLCSDCGDGVGHCAHDDPALDEIDREWATADEARRAELLEMMRALAAKYGSRVPLLMRRPTPDEPN